MIGALMEGTAVISMILIPSCVVALVEHKKKVKEQKQRELRLIREMELVLAREEAVLADRQARIEQAKASLANWKPIQFDEPAVEARKPRKWGRHAVV